MTGKAIPPFPEEWAALAEVAQLAAGVLAARYRGDLDGAEALLREFPTPEARALGFFAVAELSLALLAHHSGEPVENVVRELSLNIAHAQPTKR
jgi:hypothetical protein